MAEDTDDDYDEMWDTLCESLRGIHAKKASSLSFELLYRNAYKLVLKKQGSVLYTKVMEFENTWLLDDVRPPMVKLVEQR